MSTSAFICKANNDNTYTSIYCNWDGNTVGEILDKSYNTDKLVNDLLSLGSISMLGNNINGSEKHSFETPDKDTTISYYRDRGEDLNIMMCKDYEDLLNTCKQSFCKYLYIWQNNKWNKIIL